MLAPGTRVGLDGGGRVVVEREIGQGGQGWVYSVSDGSRRFALKWYRQPSASPAQLRALRLLVDRGMLNDRFLWPLSLARVDDRPDGFGYLMPLRPDNYLGLVHLLTGSGVDAEPISVSFEATLTLCGQLAQSFLRLHALGLCYRDVSFGNVFFAPENGDVLICDNDNVGIDGGEAAVLGTREFLAPEIVRREALPTARTDLHSLAVLLFYVLMLNHPLEGAKTDAGLVDNDWVTEHFGNDPLFIFHPLDERNRPTSSVPLLYWSHAYPQFLRDLFIQAFTVGLDDPDARVRESMWVKTMRRLRDCMTSCQCGQTVFWDAVEPWKVCTSCAQDLPRPLLLKVRNGEVVLGPITNLTTAHLDFNRDRPRPIGVGVEHPRKPGHFGLKNVSGVAWEATGPDGTMQQVQPGQAIQPVLGLRIRFGMGEGEVIR